MFSLFGGNLAELFKLLNTFSNFTRPLPPCSPTTPTSTLQNKGSSTEYNKEFRGSTKYG